MKINNIFCVGRNYAKHAAELGNEAPSKPMIFSKPTHSITYADGNSITFPSKKGEIHYEIELVLYIGKPVPEQFKVDDIVTQLALGIDFTLRDVQTTLKEKGHPWLLAKGFKNAALLTKFWDFPGVETCEQETFTLLQNDKVVQKGQAKSMIFNFQVLLQYIYENFGLAEGDVIFTGTPEGVGPIHHEDEFRLLWGEKEKGSFRVKL